MTMWPEGKKFAFTIIDDTDNSTIENVGPVYKFLNDCGILTTKSVWVYPPRDKFTGSSLSNEDYLKFVKNLDELGFEIALHNVGSGQFTRDEILQGLDDFKTLMGFYPKMHINHSSNKDNIYWGDKRYTVLNYLIKLIYGKKRRYYGDEPDSTYFWGDMSKKHIKYIRNHVFGGINTLKYDPQMPYRVKNKEEYSNFWFSSSDAHTVEEFNDLISEENIKSLEYEQGCCIVYTHFASGFVKDGILNEDFQNKMLKLSKKDGWFVPATTILDYLFERKNEEYASNAYLSRLDMLWLKDRVIKKFKYNR